MRLLYTLIILLTIVPKLNAQKYEDIIHLINTQKYSQAYTLLMDYQSVYPEFANTYYQLGNISYYWATHTNPLKNFEQTEYYINNTKLFYGLCLSKLNVQDKDVRKNREYYKTIEPIKGIEKPENPDVISFIDKQMESIKIYNKNIHEIYKNFNKFLSFYIKSVDKYKQIISKYANLNDLYLEQKSLIFKSTNDLIINFDSTQFYFNLYKDWLDKTNQIKYTPVLTKMPIDIYRLDGLVRSDFLADTIYIWDYKSWSKSVQQYLTKQVTDFRNTIIKTNKEFNQQEYDLKNFKGFKHTFKPLVLQQNIYFKIEKFDYNSVISRLLYYRVAKINLLQYNIRIFNDTSNVEISQLNRFIEFYKLYGLYKLADSLIDDLKLNINDENYKKHKDFLDFNYKNKDGFFQYITNEKVENKTIINKSIQNLLYFTYKSQNFISFSNKPLKNLNKNISNRISRYSVFDAPPNNYYTLNVAEAKAGERYFTGFYKSTAGSVGFVGKIENGEIAWLKNSSSAFKSNESGILISATDFGCVVILHSYMNGKHYNNLVKFSKDGKQISIAKIPSILMPRSLYYDEINDKATIVFHGQKYDYQQNKNDSLSVIQFSFSKNKLVWKKNMALKGNVINIIQIDSTYHLYANYSSFNCDSVSYINSKSSILNIVLTSTGELKNVDEILPKYANYGVDIFKINSETIALLGFNKKVDFRKTNYKDLPTPYLLIFDKKNKIIFDSLNY